MKKNTIVLYKHFCELVKNPTGADEIERQNILNNATRAKANLEDHFKHGRKYANDPEIQALLAPVQEKKDGKKSKG